MAVNQSVSNALETAKKFVAGIDLKKWAEQIGGSAAEAIEAAVYFSLCLGVGFLFRKYFKILFASLVVAGFFVLGLEYLKFITIDWMSIKATLGISAGMDASAMVQHFFDWIKAHLLLFIASVVGFLIGYKLG
jgi:hypothetical protein